MEKLSSRIILGCMRIGKMTVEELEKLVLVAVENGIIFFDHADIYGNRQCEKLFGEVLSRNLGLREKIIIQTKCGICKDYYDSSKEHIFKQVNKSLELLQTSYLDILLIHRPDALANYQEINEAFEELYASGKVREFGVSNMNCYQMALFQKYVKQPIKYNQVQLSIVHSHLISQGLFVNMSESEAIDHSSGIIEYCMLHEIKIQAWSVLMASWEDGSFIDNPKYAELDIRLNDLATKYHVQKNAIAVSWILRHPAEIMPIIGTTKINRIREIVQAENVCLTRQEWYSLYLASGHDLP